MQEIKTQLTFPQLIRTINYVTLHYFWKHNSYMEVFIHFSSMTYPPDIIVEREKVVDDAETKVQLQM